MASSGDVSGKLGGRRWQAQGTSGGKFRGHVSGKLKGVNYIQSSLSAGDNGGLSGANGPYVVGNAQRKSKPRKPPAWSSPPNEAAVQTARLSAAAIRPPLPTTRPTQSAQSLVYLAHRAQRADSRRLAPGAISSTSSIAFPFATASRITSV